MSSAIQIQNVGKTFAINSSTRCGASETFVVLSR